MMPNTLVHTSYGLVQGIQEGPILSRNPASTSCRSGSVSAGYLAKWHRWSDQGSTEATTLAHTFLKILDVSPEDLSPLEQIPAERLVEATSALPDWQGTTGTGDMIHFSPVIDGAILPQPPLQAIASGVAKHIPLIVGTTKDEYLFYPFADPTWREADDETLLRRVQQQVGAACPRVAPFYLEDQSDAQSLLRRLLSLLTFDQFIFPAIQLAQAQVRQGTPDLGKRGIVSVEPFLCKKKSQPGHLQLQDWAASGRPRYGHEFA